MDEYRPYPTEQPLSVTTDETLEDTLDEAPENYLPEEPSSSVAIPVRTGPDTEHPGGHLHGTVARLNRPRRFGFLRADDGAEIFFHASALEAGPNSFDALRPGQEVEFDCHQDDQGRGLAASLVVAIGEPPEPPRQPRPPRAERAAQPSRSPRAAGWHVVVLHERPDSPMHSQLERLLNERSVKPGQFTVAVGGAECWVAYFTGPESK
jgi:cold shock CspA family protein